jgi:DNA-binding response OmpR family regulator
MKTLPSPEVLILEDEALIALDLENMLLDAQAGQLTVLTSCAAAMAWLSQHTPDVAVIDIFLYDGECIDVAGTLVERGVPFVVHSARSRATDEAHRVFLNGHWISKPADPAELVAAVKGCLLNKRATATDVAQGAPSRAAC